MRNSPLILITDDDLGFIEIISTKLKRNGFLVAEAHNGEEAVEKAKNLRPDLIVMDINMPNENGTEAALEIRRYPENKDVKIVFFTSLKDPWPGIKAENKDFAHELGAVEFIDKSEDIDIVAEKIKNQLKSN